MAHLSDLKPDGRNARRHSPRNLAMIEESIQRNGFGRSILLANDGTIIAGNATYESSASAGFDDVMVIETDGTKVIAVKRTDVAPGSEQFHNLALADNRAAELADWSPEVLAELSGELDLSQFFYEDELQRVLSQLPDTDEWGNAMGVLPDGDKSPFQQITFTVADEQAEQVQAALGAAKRMGPFIGTGNENSNGNALARICETFLTEYGR